MLAGMGMLIRGQWSTQWYTPGKGGSFEREATRFRGRVTADGSSGHPAVAGRYHLYVAWACPWAHRTVLIRTLRGLESVIGVSVVDAFMGDDGWSFGEDPQCTSDALFGARYLREVYVRADPEYTGRVTVPVLWDREKGTIVSNESREILRMLDVEFDALARPGTSFCPPALRERIDAVLDDIYPVINNGVYRAGFAAEQAAHDEAVTALFAALDRWEAHLGDQRYLCGDRPTEADLCMFTTLVRFDAVYHGHFKCNLRRIADYPNLSNYLRDLYQLPGVAPLCKFDQIKAHYYRSHPHINPTRIVPRGPLQDLGAPHDRARFA
jgi:putative glutathione S-transferase